MVRLRNRKLSNEKFTKNSGNTHPRFSLSEVTAIAAYDRKHAH